MKKKLAIIGSGISAMTCAHYLRDDYEISIFDRNDYLGGHTHTHEFEDNGHKFTIDTGFIVFNLHTYNNLLKLFAELCVERQKSSMSFAVYNQKTGLQYSGSSLFHLFSQPKNLLSLQYWKFLFEINKFFKMALDERESIQGSDETISQYCKRKNLSNYFLDNYLAPMSSAVWSTPHQSAYDLPISLIIPFFYNHGLLGVNRQFQWYTVKGGSNDYTKKIVENSNFAIHLQEAALEVKESEAGVQLITEKGSYNFDYAILASHSDESLKIATELSAVKKQLLEKFSYSRNRAVLHTDISVMPTIRNAWASWNHVINKESGQSSTVYWMNELQKPDTKTNYFVSINPFQEIDKNKIVKELIYDHPLFTVENFALQKRLQELNQNTKIFFAGAYFGYGFHEDGIKSGLQVVEILKNNK
ncbi:MAG: FAD-dependent oxidoreductase [Candidatus Falkowbacteria bacterium]|nr:MAG: FAD-dependent oxidoreductase [Candidatus Falkowbacteria bacterium]